MSAKLLLIGLDCLGPEILAPESLAELPNLERLFNRGVSGSLESTLPPITVPAWTSMLSGRDPGELGVYGFRNRRSYGYGDLVYATSASVRHHRIWDYVAQVGEPSIVVGVPQTFPAPAINGNLVAGFEAQGASDYTTSPPSLVSEVRAIVPGYQHDVPEFRHHPLNDLRDLIEAMTRARFKLMRHLLSSRTWTFAMLCEIGPDRMHHAFWRYHDPSHPHHEPNSSFRSAIRNYYEVLDEGIGDLIEIAGDQTAIIVCSDHGAGPMHGGVFINEILRDKGWLVLREAPKEPAQLEPAHVDWSRTRAWADGGYYSRVFLNVKGREPQGIVDADDRDKALSELTVDLETLELRDGPKLRNRVVRPENIYRRVRGLPPDLLVFFDDLRWRSLGSVGYPLPWIVGNDTGPDDANHAQQGMFIATRPGVAHIHSKAASIYDVFPTALEWLQLPVPADLVGRSLFARAT